MTNLASLSNTRDGVILATEDLTLTGINTLTNDASTIQATTLLLDQIDTLNNVNTGTIYSGDSLQLSNIESLKTIIPS